MSPAVRRATTEQRAALRAARDAGPAPLPTLTRCQRDARALMHHAANLLDYHQGRLALDGAAAVPGAIEALDLILADLRAARRELDHDGANHP